MPDELAPKNKMDPYVLPIVFTTSGEMKVRATKGQLVTIINRSYDKRGLSLIPQPTRVLCQNEIHELITTDEVDAGPNKTVDRISTIGFIEIIQGGCVAVGEPVFINGKEIGKIAGFDETHFPNHYNIVVISPERFTGTEVNLNINDDVIIGDDH